MAADRIPYSWIGAEVVVQTGRTYSASRGLACTLLDITSEGVLLRYTVPDERDGEREEIAFYPWRTVDRVRKA